MKKFGQMSISTSGHTGHGSSLPKEGDGIPEADVICRRIVQESTLLNCEIKHSDWTMLQVM